MDGGPLSREIAQFKFEVNKPENGWKRTTLNIK
jgi:hypothetical protein